MAQPRYWSGPVPELDSFNRKITDEFIDGRVRGDGRWACFTPESWHARGYRKLGVGFGQRYRKQADGRWLKVEG